MKLIKRTQPEKGIIVFNHYNGYNYVVENDENQECLKCKCFCEKGLFLDSTENSFGNFEYIGKINYNFEIKNGKLIKIKLPEICVDDVFETENGSFYISFDYLNGEFDIVYSDGRVSEKMVFGDIIKHKHKGNLAYSHKIEGGV